MSTFTETGAQSYRDSQLNGYLRSLEQDEDILDDAQVTDAIVEAGIDDSILEAAVYAVRNQDFGFLVRQYERLAGPVVSKAREDAQKRSDAMGAQW